MSSLLSLCRHLLDSGSLSVTGSDSASPSVPVPNQMSNRKKRSFSDLSAAFPSPSRRSLVKRRKIGYFSNSMSSWNESTDLVSTPMGFQLSRSEMVSVVLQFLENAGYNESVECLTRESGVERRSTNCRELSRWILDGDWETVRRFVDSLRCSLSPRTLCLVQMLIVEQK